jgi:superfamily I DNA/RNA helicase
VQALDAAGLGHAVLGDETPTEFEVQLDVVPASLAKGLEFDHVVLVEPAGIVDGEADRVTGLRRLYVCLTRAVTSLVVLHGEALPEPLAGGAGLRAARAAPRRRTRTCECGARGSW